MDEKLILWVRYLLWNFKEYLWNSTQNILPLHWKNWFLHNVEILELSDLRAHTPQVRSHNMWINSGSLISMQYNYPTKNQSYKQNLENFISMSSANHLLLYEFVV